jgi:hypothetical protein
VHFVNISSIPNTQSSLHYPEKEESGKTFFVLFSNLSQASPEEISMEKDLTGRDREKMNQRKREREKHELSGE